MTTTRENIQRSLKQIASREKSNVDFAARIGEKKQAVSHWLNGRNTPDIETIAKISKIYGVPISAIFSGDISDVDKTEEQGFDFIEVPLYGSIAAGAPIEMISADDTHPIPAPMHDRYPNAFLLRVSGESMNHVLPNGCYALIDPRKEICKDNDPYAVCVNGFDATVKRVKKLENGFQLVPDSTDPTFPVQTFNYNEPGTDEITVIGKVVWHVIPFDWAY
ncbi:LexA family protein [Gordonibacter sp.]|uniref:LexA family protein n=1 Tax=Gordonibacter sp. TaxID=1968902 RepID=UPI002FC6F5F9